MYTLLLILQSSPLSVRYSTMEMTTIIIIIIIIITQNHPKHSLETYSGNDRLGVDNILQTASSDIQLVIIQFIQKTHQQFTGFKNLSWTHWVCYSFTFLQPARHGGEKQIPQQVQQLHEQVYTLDPIPSTKPINLHRGDRNCRSRLSMKLKRVTAVHELEVATALTT